MHTRLMPYSCVWVAHNDCLNFGAIRYLENHDQVRAAAREGWSLAAAHERGRVARGVTGDAVDGGCGGAGGEGAEADARLCSIDKRIHQTVHAMQHVARQRVLVVLTSASGPQGRGCPADTGTVSVSEGFETGAGGAGGGAEGDYSKQCAMRIFADDSLDELWRVLSEGCERGRRREGARCVCVVRASV